MGRCQKYPDEGECFGHDCIDRVGTPCIFDKLGLAGTEDMVIGVDLANGEDFTAGTDDLGTDPRGVECWMKPCNSIDCAEFGPVNCLGRE